MCIFNQVTLAAVHSHRVRWTSLQRFAIQRFRSWEKSSDIVHCDSRYSSCKMYLVLGYRSREIITCMEDAILFSAKCPLVLVITERQINDRVQLNTEEQANKHTR